MCSLRGCHGIPFPRKNAFSCGELQMMRRVMHDLCRDVMSSRERTTDSVYSEKELNTLRYLYIAAAALKPLNAL